MQSPATCWNHGRPSIQPGRLLKAAWRKPSPCSPSLGRISSRRSWTHAEPSRLISRSRRLRYARQRNDSLWCGHKPANSPLEPLRPLGRRPPPPPRRPARLGAEDPTVFRNFPLDLPPLSRVFELAGAVRQVPKWCLFVLRERVVGDGPCRLVPCDLGTQCTRCAHIERGQGPPAWRQYRTREACG